MPSSTHRVLTYPQVLYIDCEPFIEMPLVVFTRIWQADKRTRYSGGSRGYSRGTRGVLRGVLQGVLQEVLMGYFMRYSRGTQGVLIGHGRPTSARGIAMAGVVHSEHPA